MNRRSNSQDAQLAARVIGKRIPDGLREAREIVGRIIIDKDDLVVFANEMPEAIQADRRPFVQIITVGVVSAVNDDTEHL